VASVRKGLVEKAAFEKACLECNFFIVFPPFSLDQLLICLRSPVSISKQRASVLASALLLIRCIDAVNMQ